MFNKCFFLGILIFYAHVSAMENELRDDSKDSSIDKLPNEVWQHIVLQLLNEIDLSDIITNTSEDPLQLKKAYRLVKPFRLSCRDNNHSSLVAIKRFYLHLLTNYTRHEKIQCAQGCYNSDNLCSTALLLTSIAKSKSLENNNFLEKSLFIKLVSLKSHSIQFKLGTAHADNKKLIGLLLSIRSDTMEDSLITTNQIFHTVLTTSNNEKILKFLVKQDPLIPNDYISSELMRDSFKGDIIAFKSADKQKIVEANSNHFNAIIWAIIGGKEALLKTIFPSIVTPESLIIPDALNQTLLHYGACYANPVTLNFLLSQLDTIQGNNLNFKNNNNQSPLCMALISGSEAKVLILLNKGADIRTLFDSNSSSSYDGESEMLQKLIENKNIIGKIAKEIYNSNSVGRLRAEDLIAYCNKSKEMKEKSFKTIITLGGLILSLLAYAEFL